MTLIGFLMTAPGDVSAMKNSAGMPKNAHAKEYGSGWSCDRGYREVKGRCIAVKVPANAYPTDTSFSRGWECGRGFRDIKDACVAIKVRTNGYLNSSGDRWECNRGFREVDEACIAIKVPAH